MRLGRPKAALILTDEERVRLDSLARGLEFHPDLVAAFIRMLRQGEAQVLVLSEETSI